MYTCNEISSKYLRQKKKNVLLERKMNKPIILAGHFYTFLSVTDKSVRKKISKDVIYLNDLINLLIFIEYSKQQQQNILIKLT